MLTFLHRYILKQCVRHVRVAEPVRIEVVAQAAHNQLRHLWSARPLLLPVRAVIFQIEIDRRPLLTNIQGEGGLAHLARPEQHDGRGMAQQVGQAGDKAPGMHLCIQGPYLHIYILQSR